MYLSSVIQSRLARHLLFWLAFYALYIKLGLTIQGNWKAVAIIYIGKIAIQALAAYVLVYVLIPRLLNKKKYFLFGLVLLGWTYLVYALLVISRGIYLEPAFINFFEQSEKHIPIIRQSVLIRLTDLDAYLDAVPWLFTPAAFMGLVKFYQTQLKFHKIAEEKTSMELTMLKNQLNPHFLFNTLNNLYALVLKKDERAPEAIAKLSEMLDFVIYRCNDDLVSLSTTISLLENFIALENLRYGTNRLEVVFAADQDNDYKVPSLIFLTLLENAFTHGVTNEIGKAYIHISLSAKENKINFNIENSKPEIVVNTTQSTTGVGIRNIMQQLALLYPARHQLSVNEQQKSFCVNLVLHGY